MVNLKKKETTSLSANWNAKMLEFVAALRKMNVAGQEVFVHMNKCGLATVKCGTKCGVTNGTSMVLEMQYESIEILENNWMVACRHGIYKLYDKDGNPYNGLKFLKKQNAIKFARTL